MNSNDYALLAQTAQSYGAQVLYDEPMNKHTSFKIGGRCDIMIKINCEKLLCELVRHCNENSVPYYIIGRGSNILVSDEGLRGAVFLLGSDFGSVRVRGDEIICNAGASLSAVCRVALENSLTGLEFAYGIPGSVGGAVFMNAGAYGGEMKDVVVSCRCIDEQGRIKELSNDKMELSYRHSIFSEKKLCITSVTFKLKKGDKEAINSRMEELMERRRKKQPLEYPSAGSTFKRPKGDFAARLIEECGLKGASCGGAEVSTKHSGFVINRDNATFDDVMGVVSMVKQRVFEQTGIALECEILIMK